VVVNGCVDLFVPGVKTKYILVTAVVTFYFCFILFYIITLSLALIMQGVSK
jgi:hypothetical protein